jgi:demethylmenaquinone methyltransferase/2-methoxy-6-polyprenyl-1,4-benzoquinol methylase
VASDLLDKKEVRIQRMFGQIAPWYDFLNHLLSLNIDKRWRKKVTRLVPPQAGEAILDLCTGTGDLAFEYDRAGQQKSPITAADFCHEMLVRAIKKGESRQTTERIRFVEADAQNLPFPDDTFGIVSVSFGLRNITDPNLGLAEMKRVLKPGGKLAVLEFSRPRGRILGPMYTGYFRKVLPRIGQVLSRNQESAYRYLPESVLTFPDGEDLCNQIRSHGFVDVSHTPLTFGIATLYVGTRPSEGRDSV